MTNLHRLPEPVPEGWEPPSVATEISRRPIPGGFLYAGRHTGNTPWVYATGGTEVPIPFDWQRGPPRFLREACAAAERAFCGCYVGAKVKGTWGKGT